MSGLDKTVILVTNLDRPAIEAKLAAVRKAALAKDLPDLASLFIGVEGMPRAQIESKVRNAVKWLADKPGLGDISAQLQLVEVNLPNLKE
jgi:hypothetical protein